MVLKILNLCITTAREMDKIKKDFERAEFNFKVALEHKESNLKVALETNKQLNKRIEDMACGNKCESRQCGYCEYGVEIKTERWSPSYEGYHKDIIEVICLKNPICPDFKRKE